MDISLPLSRGSFCFGSIGPVLLAVLLLASAGPPAVAETGLTTTLAIRSPTAAESTAAESTATESTAAESTATESTATESTAAESTSTASEEGASASASVAQDTERDVKFYGPLRIRDLMPLTLLFMDFVPSHAVEGSAGVLFVEFHHSHANTFIMSSNVREYLEARGTLRQRLTDDDFAAIRGLENDAFYFDGAAGYANLTVHYSFSRDWNAYLKVPYIYYSGGLLDSGIESFHDAFGFSDAGRPYAPKNISQVLVKIGDEALEISDPGSNQGFADPVLALSKAFRRGKNTIVVEGAVKFALADTDQFLSSGANDYGIQVSLHKQWERRALYLAASYVKLGTSGELPDFGLEDVQKISGSYERLFGRRMSFVLQGSLSPSPFQNTDSELEEAKLQLSIGLRYAFQKTGALEFGLTENVSNFDSTPDIGFHFGFGLPIARLGGKG